MMKIFSRIFLASALVLFALTAEAVVLYDSSRCGAGNALNGITPGDVTGNSGDASECWGTFNGNDPGPSGDGFEIDGIIFDFVAKQEMGTPAVWEGVDIGLVVSPDDGTATSGTWAFNPGSVSVDFLVVLKAASDPGYAVWLFEGADAASNAGDWAVAWTNSNDKARELSHLSIYSSRVPVPAAVWLFGSGLLALVGVARRKRV